MKVWSLIAAGASAQFSSDYDDYGDSGFDARRFGGQKDLKQYASWEGSPRSCQPNEGQCMDLEECLLSQHNMEVYSVIRNRGNSIQAKYEIGCMPGFSPNMEGQQTTTVACNRQKDDLTKLNWRVFNSFQCIQTGQRFDQRLGTRTLDCPSAGIDYFVSENFVREDNSATAQWTGPLFDNNGAFIRTRIPTSTLANQTPTDYAEGFIIFVVYNQKLSGMPAGEGDLRFTMYSSDFDFVTTTEDDESTVVVFKSTQDPGAALGTGFNAYFSIEGIQMDETQHENFQIGTRGIADLKAACCKTQDADGNEVDDPTCNLDNCVNDEIINLATCILPLISGTPATP